MLIKDVQKVYYIQDGMYFEVTDSVDDVHNYEFPMGVTNNNDIKIYKQCLDGHIKEILIENTI